MAWPVDARNKSYTAGVSVPSSDLNEHQDRIVDLHRIQTVDISAGMAVDSGGVPAWFYDSVNGYWNSIAVTGDLVIPIQLRNGGNGAIIRETRIKWGRGVGVEASVLLRSVDSNIATPATAPAVSAIWGPTTPGIPISTWTTIVNLAIGKTLGPDEMLFLRVDPIGLNNKLGGVQVTYEPLTPTP